MVYGLTTLKTQCLVDHLTEVIHVIDVNKDDIVVLINALF